MSGGGRKVRIIGGQWRHAYLQIPPAETTRPISDRAKEALFNILGDVGGLSVLDAYAGSGNLGFEALSRGAERVEAVEADRAAAATIAANAASLGVSQAYQLSCQSVESWLETNIRQFDLIFADPPFGSFDEAVLAALVSHLRRRGTFVLKHASTAAALEFAGVTCRLNRRYGASVLSFYK